MELLDRYLQAVKKHLPWQGQDDIMAELRVNLESQLEDKQAALGRPLTTGETEDWLKEIGPPLHVAARYQPQQYLIGPSVFPTYYFVLRTAFFWAAIVYSIVSIIQIFASPAPSGGAVFEAFLRLPGILLTTAAWITLTFAVIEFAFTHYPGLFPVMPGSPANWTPSSLPPLEKQPASETTPRSYAHAAAEVVFGCLMLSWLLLIPKHPSVLLGPGAAYLQAFPFQLAYVCVLFFWGIVSLNLLQLIWRCIDLWQGTWQNPSPVRPIVFKIFGVAPLLLLLSVRDHVWVLLKHPAVDQERYGATLNQINQGIYRVLLLICAIVTLQLLWDIGRISVDSYRKHIAAMR